MPSITGEIKLTKRKLGAFIYILWLGPKKLNNIKIGMTTDPTRRFKDIAKYYECDITIVWMSPEVSKYTAIRVEDELREQLIESGWAHMPNDRFIKPTRVKSIEVKISKKYKVLF